MLQDGLEDNWRLVVEVVVLEGDPVLVNVDIGYSLAWTWRMVTACVLSNVHR